MARKGLISGRFGRRAQRHFDGLDVLREELGANSFGVESAGKTQVRGNGNLALTAEELIFAQWIPNRVTRIPRGSILEVTTTRAHLGKTIGRRRQLSLRGSALTVTKISQSARHM